MDDTLWIVSESEFDPARLHHQETVFTLGNGYLGTRGAFEEGYPGAWPATFVHGIYDAVPIAYTELVNCPDWLPLAVVVVIKLLLKPLAAGVIAEGLNFPDLWKDVLVLLAAMPPAVLGPIFLKRYGGDAALASALLLSATLISVGTLLLVFYVLG